MTERIDVGACSLELLDNGTYLASVIPNGYEPWVTVPEEYNGIPITEIQMVRCAKGIKRMICVPKTVKIFMNSICFDTGDPPYVVLVSPENPWLCSDDKAVFSKDKKILYAFTARSDESYIIPDSVKIIYENAFWKMRALKSLVFPEGLEEIGKMALWNCGAEDVRLPKSVKKLGENALALLSVNSLILPDNIEEMGENVFWDSSCLSSVYLSDCYNKPEYGIPNYFLAPEYIIDENSNAFVIIDGVIYTKDMKALLAVTKKAPSVISVPEGVEVIGMNASVHNDNICEIILPKSVHTIMKRAFEGCTLKKINLDDVKIIEEGAFGACKYLTETGKISAEKIGICCFIGCKSLDKVHITNVKEIGGNAFCRFKKRVEIILAGEPETANISFATGCIVKVMSADTNEIQYAVKVFDVGDILDTNEVQKLVNGLLSKKHLFSLKNYDRYFERFNNNQCLLSKYEAAHYRIKYPMELTDRAREMYTGYIDKFTVAAIQQILKKPNVTVEEIVNFPYLDRVNEKELLELIEFSAQLNLTEITAFLMAYKKEHFPGSDDNKEEKWKI